MGKKDDFFELLSEKHPSLQWVAKELEGLFPGALEVSRGVVVTTGVTDYAQNFSLQWHTFSSTQRDSANHLRFSEDRLFSTTGWDRGCLEGKLVLEIGSGAGRFTEILLKYGAVVVSVDLSSAVFANELANSSERLIVVRGDFVELRSLPKIFDYVLAFGVAQHIPRPKAVYEVSAALTKPEGLVAIDHYRKRVIPTNFYHPKYVWRPLTKRLDPKLLLKIVSWYVPRYVPFDTAIVKLFGPKLSKQLRGLIPIPCWNYFGVLGFPQDMDSLIEWAILDTFDALGAEYDQPISKRKLRKWVSEMDYRSYQIRLGGTGLVFNGVVA